MWLKNTRNDTYYPYSDFLSKHGGMIKVYENPFESVKTIEEPLYFTHTPILMFDDEPVVEEVVEEEEAVAIPEVEVVPEEVHIKQEVLKPKKIVKRVTSKPKSKVKK